MRIAKLIFSSLTGKERRIFVFIFALFLVALATKATVVIANNSQYVPVEGGYYREGVIGQPTAINPVISDNPIDQDLSTLVYADLKDLSESISIKEEGKAYLVKLKEGLKWDNGSPLTSDDVLFTIKTIQNPEIQSPFYKTWKGVITERISELQIKFTLPGPFVFFEENLNDLPVIPKHIFGDIPASNIRLSSYNLEPVSSGPYSFENLSKKRNGFITEYRFKANKHFAGDKPYIKEIYFQFYEDQADLLSDFKTRNVDGFGTAGLPDERVYKLAKAEIEKISTPLYYSVFFNPKATSILNREDFRNALSMAVDRKKLAQEILRGEAVPFDSLSDLIENESTIAPRKEEAREIISEIKEDKEEDIIVEIVIPEVKFIEKTAEFIEKEWEDVGVDDVKIVALTNEDFIRAVIRERNYEAVIFGNVLEHHLDLFPFWHSSERFFPGLNLAFYSNDSVDTALENIRQAETREERETEFKKAVGTIEDNSPAAFLFTLPYTYIHHNRLYGFQTPNRFVSPSDRLEMINKWYVNRARVIKNGEVEATSTQN